MEKKTLLEGNIRRQLIGLAVPLFLGSVLQQLYNTADSLIVSQFLGVEAFASTGVSGTIMNLFIFILHGFCTGISVLFSASYGAGNIKSFRKQLYTALAFGSGFTIFLSILFIALTRPILRLLQTPDNLFSYCSAYLTMILAGLIATYLYNLFSGVLQALGDTKASLYFLAVSVAFNIILDILMVGILPFGIRGAAIATILAQGLSALFCFLFFLKKYPEQMCTRQDVGIHREYLNSILEYGVSSAMHQSSLYIGKMMVQGIVNTLGISAIAAFTAATRIEGFINAPGDSCATSISIFISQNRAAKKKERVSASLKEMFCIMGVFVTIMISALYLVAPSALRLFLGSADPAAMEAGLSYLRTVLIFYFASYLGSYFVGCAKGHGWMKVPVFGTLTHLTFRILISFFFARHIGLKAVALGTGIGWCACDIYHGYMFRKIRKAERET